MTVLDEVASAAERKAVLAALNSTRGHRDEAAVVLGVSLRTLHRKMNELHLREHPDVIRWDEIRFEEEASQRIAFLKRKINSCV